MQYVTTSHSLRVFLDATIESDIGFTLPVMWRKHIRSGIKSVILDGSGLDGLAKSGLAWLVEAHKTMAILQVEVVLAYMPIDSIRWGGDASFQMLLPGVTGQHIEQHEGVTEQMLVDIELLTSDPRQCGSTQRITVTGDLDQPRTAAECILQRHIDAVVMIAAG